MQELLNIWSDIAPPEKDKARIALDITFLTRAQALLIKTPNITHTISVLSFSLSFHTEDPDKVSNAVNIFMLPKLSLEVKPESVLVAWQWDT